MSLFHLPLIVHSGFFTKHLSLDVLFSLDSIYTILHFRSQKQSIIMNCSELSVSKGWFGNSFLSVLHATEILSYLKTVGARKTCI